MLLRYYFGLEDSFFCLDIEKLREDVTFVNVFLQYESFGNKQPKIKLFSFIFAACAKLGANHCAAVVRY